MPNDVGQIACNQETVTHRDLRFASPFHTPKVSMGNYKSREDKPLSASKISTDLNLDKMIVRSPASTRAPRTKRI
jgi:hypothetical protein